MDRVYLPEEFARGYPQLLSEPRIGGYVSTLILLYRRPLPPRRHKRHARNRYRRWPRA